MKEIPIAMTIAGSDSGGGAGIEADLKTFAALGVHGTVTVTAVTAQNTCGVYAIQDIDLDVIEKQFDAVFEDIGVDAVKTGMLYKREVISLVAKKIKQHNLPLVVDPVMMAKSGARLLLVESEEALKKVLLPVATVVTPNSVEAAALTGMKVETLEDMREAAKKIIKFGPRAVVIKGGHVNTGDNVVDVAYVDGEFREFIGRRIQTNATHGTGCGFSAAITAELAKGKSIIEAVAVAKEFIENAVRYGLKVGKCYGPINPTSWTQIPAEKYFILETLSKAIVSLESHSEVAQLIPEVQSNIAMAISKQYLRDVRDVAAVPGRLVKYKNTVKASGPPEFGASFHLARILLKVLEYDPNIRSLMNIRYSPEIVKTFKRLGYSVSSFSRKDEPKKLKTIEGGTLPWGIEFAIKKVGRMPDIIYDVGDIGKEPMIRVFGKDAMDVANKIINVAGELSKTNKKPDLERTV